jgi:hypothetical protein
MRPLYQNLSTSASLKQIASLAGLSLRQLGRDLGDLTKTFGLFGAGFRDAMRVLRLRAAVLLLSALALVVLPRPYERLHALSPATSLGAPLVALALASAALPAPSLVQEAVRYRG